MTNDRDARRKILDEGMELFATKGFTATTVRDIATAAGVNLAIIHYYFGNKEGLYRAIFERKVSEVHSLLAEAAAFDGSNRERIERFVRAYARFICAHHRFARIIQHELITGGSLFQEIFRPQIARNYALLRGIVEDGVRSGEFRSVDVDITPVSLIGMIAFFIIAQPLISGMIGGCAPDGEFEKRLADHTLNLFLHGILADDESIGGTAEESA